MGPELIGIIITGVLSGLDVVVNVFVACCHGRLKIDVSDCCTVEHDDKEDILTKSQVENIVEHRLSK